ncbi:hypothetical protein [Natranaeroarchaeum sulfidigenes]|uniref:hypothetical protein n=1 Tax=Natranaeroarchaeum sulfidigenes TaxID=2784880 RepID=UPI001EE54147|nr:hypothetical protein [Natranaeroarchaeum sulfidigenes]
MSTPLSNVSESRAAMGLGALLVLAGSALPWWVTPVESSTGLAGDGVFTMLFGAVVLGILVFQEQNERTGIVVAGFGALTAVVAGWFWYGTATDPAVAAGSGVYLTLLGAGTLLAGGWMGYRGTQD